MFEVWVRDLCRTGAGDSRGDRRAMPRDMYIQATYTYICICIYIRPRCLRPQGAPAPARKISALWGPLRGPLVLLGPSDPLSPPRPAHDSPHRAQTLLKTPNIVFVLTFSWYAKDLSNDKWKSALGTGIASPDDGGSVTW